MNYERNVSYVSRMLLEQGRPLPDNAPVFIILYLFIYCFICLCCCSVYMFVYLFGYFRHLSGYWWPSPWPCTPDDLHSTPVTLNTTQHHPLPPPTYCGMNSSNCYLIGACLYHMTVTLAILCMCLVTAACWLIARCGDC